MSPGQSLGPVRLVVSIYLRRRMKMYKGIKLFLIIIAILPPLFFTSCYCARPPRPGSHFVWVERRTTLNGVVIPSHWKYVGPPVRGKVWVPAHYGPNRIWIAGRWKVIRPPRTNAVWVSGHYGRHGSWIPGHWRR